MTGRNLKAGRVLGERVLGIPTGRLWVSGCTFQSEIGWLACYLSLTVVLPFTWRWTERNSETIRNQGVMSLNKIERSL